MYAADNVLTNFNDCRARVYNEPGCGDGNAYTPEGAGYDFKQIGTDSDVTFEQPFANNWFDWEIRSIQLPGKSKLEFYPDNRFDGIGQILHNTFD